MKTPAANPTRDTRMLMRNQHKTQGKPPDTGDSALPHPMKIPGETQDMWHAGEYENGMDNGSKYD